MEVSGAFLKSVSIIANNWRESHIPLTCYSIITPLKYHVFENIMENGAFALLEQLLHFP